MACCVAKRDETDFKISKELAREQREAEKHPTIKILLLGTGEAGKSTITKQMKLMYLGGYSQEELSEITPSLHFNITSAMRDILRRMGDAGIALESPATQDAAKSFDLQALPQLTPHLATNIQTLYNDAQVKAFMKTCNDINEHIEYMFTRVNEIAAPSYVPTMEDMLKVRITTTGIVEINYKIDDVKFKVCDMGGQRSERRKWVMCFDNVTAIIFVVASSEYDQVLREDPTTNRMHESLKLFKDTINNKYFVDTPIILFLNKMDLFKQKIKTSDLKNCFPDYEGGNSSRKGIAFITEKFMECNKNKNRMIFPHQTCATDTDAVRNVLNDARTSLMEVMFSKLNS